MTLPEPWEETDIHEGTTHWVVIIGEDYSISRINAIFDSEEAALYWVEVMQKHPDEELRYPTHDISVLPMRGLTGFVWNSYDPVPPHEDV